MIIKPPNIPMIFHNHIKQMAAKEKIKKIIWDSLVAFCTVIPDPVLRSFNQLIIYSIGRKGTRPAFISLLNMSVFIEWNIDKNAIQLEGGVHPKHRLIGYHDFFCERIQPGETVLDAGCGHGAVSYTIAQKGAIVTGIDIDLDSVEFGKRKFIHPNLQLICADVFEIIPHHQFDVVVLSNVLEHLEKRIELLQNFQEKYMPKKFLLRVPMFNRNWLVPYKKELGIPYFSDPTHQIEYSIEEFMDEMKAAGLSVVEITTNWGEIWAVAKTNEQ